MSETVGRLVSTSDRSHLKKLLADGWELDLPVSGEWLLRKTFSDPAIQSKKPDMTRKELEEALKPKFSGVMSHESGLDEDTLGRERPVILVTIPKL
jgi:hypothetical protein